MYSPISGVCTQKAKHEEFTVGYIMIIYSGS